MTDDSQIGVGDLYRKLDSFSERMDKRFETLSSRLEDFLRRSEVNDATFDLRLNTLENEWSEAKKEKGLSKRHRAQMFWGLVGSFVLGVLGILANFLH